MGAYTCQFGFVHKMCRCPDEHTISCDNPGHRPELPEVPKERRLPIGWKTKAHECELPFVVFFTPALGDIWECHHCKREWEVNSIVSNNPDTYGRYRLGFRLVICDTKYRSKQ